MRKQWFELACLAAGLAILGAMVWQIGLAALGRDLRAIGWRLPVVLILQALGLVLPWPFGTAPGVAWLAGASVALLMSAAFVWLIGHGLWRTSMVSSSSWSSCRRRSLRRKAGRWCCSPLSASISPGGG